MNDLLSITIEVGLTIGTSAGAVALLTPRLRRAFQNRCGGVEMIDCWVMCLALLFLLVPLLLVLFTTEMDLHLQFAHLTHMKEIFFRTVTVMGLTLCLLGVGLAAWMMRIDQERHERKELRP